jgi:hypothetical protein
MANNSASDKDPAPWASNRSRGRSSVGHSAANCAAAALSSTVGGSAGDPAGDALASVLDVVWEFLMIASLQMKGRLTPAAAYGNWFQITGKNVRW